MHARTITRSRGLGLVEIGLGSVLVAVAAGGLLQMQSDADRTVRANSAASKMQIEYTAAQSFLQVYKAQLTTLVPVGGGVAAIPVGRASATSPVPSSAYAGIPSLQGGGFLAANFVDVNAFGQSSVLLIRQPQAGLLAALLTTVGGRAMTDNELGQAATKVGQGGGLMLAHPPSGVAGAVVQGAYGGWQDPAGVWAAGPSSPRIGHLMATSALDNGAPVSDYLDRYDTGVPEANKLHAHIDVNGNNLDNVANIDTETVSNTRGSNVAVNSDLAVSGAGNFGGDLSTGGDLAAAGNASIGNTLTANTGVVGQQFLYSPGTVYGGNLFSYGSTTSEGDINGYANSNIAGNGTVGGSYDVGSFLRVGGAGSFGGDLSTGGDLYGGNLNLRGSASVGGFIGANGRIETQSDITAQGNGRVNGNFEVGNGLAVYGSQTVAGNSQVGGSVMANGDIVANGYINSVAGLASEADVHAGGNLFSQNNAVVNGFIQSDSVTSNTVNGSQINAGNIGAAYIYAPVICTARGCY